LMQAHARKLQTAEETRTLGQLRADVFTDMLLRYPDHAYQPTVPDNGTTTIGSGTTAATTTLKAGATTEHDTDPATTLKAGDATEHDTDANNTITSGTATERTATQDTDPGETTAGDTASGHAAADDAAAGNCSSGSGATGKGSCTCGGGNTTASVAVTAPLTTLLGLAEDPGELTGYGLIPPEMTRNLTALAKSWLTVLTDDYGQAIAAAKDLRTPPEWLKRLVRLRDRHCRDFGCTVPADQCEIDHTIAWEDGGKTVPENLTARCKPGHKTKHHGGGTVTQDHDGTLHI
ncbi:HNH endonuclease, partial [Arthrobacter sp. CAU 1506]|uniref:HNH endonuclease signature motif containing protein n=1 Tax=Arthrobacter sp. CAU 1506 TaxID=2560052 RepID=UPI0010AB7086